MSLVGGGRGQTALGDTLQVVTPEGKKIFVANLQIIVDKQGRTGKKGAGWHPPGGDTQVKYPTEMNKSDSDEQKKVVSFSGENKYGNWQTVMTKKGQFFGKK